MELRIYGQTMKAEVDCDGTFYCVSDRKFHARTLKGLEKKLLEAFKPQGSLPVEHINGKLGIAVNVTNDRFDYNKKYCIKWDDGTQTSESTYSLRRRLTDKERADLAAAQAVKDTAHEAFNAASDVVNTLTSAFKAEAALKQAFKKN